MCSILLWDGKCLYKQILPSERSLSQMNGFYRENKSIFRASAFKYLEMYMNPFVFCL